MKKYTKVLAGLLAALAWMVATVSTYAQVTWQQGQGNSWVGTPNIMTSNPPTFFAAAENEYSTNGTSPPLRLAQSFTATQTGVLTNIQIYVSGSPVSNSIHLYDLGVPSGGNPFFYTPGTDLFAGLGFQYLGSTDASVGVLQLSGAAGVTLTSGHQYVFVIEPQADNEMTWYRSSSDVYAGGEAYRCESLFNGVNRAFALAITYAGNVTPPTPPPSTNFWVTVSAVPITNVWPGSPMIQTFANPTIPQGATAVPEGFGPSSDANGPGRVLGQAFVQTNKSFRLGAVTIRMHGMGSTNTVFFLSLYSLTNTVFSNTNAMAQNQRYPKNYVPYQDASPLSQSLLSTNLVGCYITPALIVNTNVSSGNTDELMTFTFTDPRAQVLLSSCGTALNAGTNSIYTFEITIGTNQMLPTGGLNPTNWSVGPWATNTSADALFQWIRGASANSIFEEAIYDDSYSDYGSGPGWWIDINYNECFAMPRAYQSASYTNYTGATNLSPSSPLALRTPLSGSTRDLVMAVYAAAPYITGGYYTNGYSFVLTMQPSVDGGKFAVLKKTSLRDAAWTMLVTNYPAAGVPISSSITYTDTAATAAQSFYRVTSSP